MRKCTSFATLSVVVAIGLSFTYLIGCSKAPRSPQAPVEPPARPPADTRSQPVKLLVYSPCAFAKASAKISKLFEDANPGVKVTVVVENVGSLVPRIERGAKPDVFMCIGDHEVKELEKKGLVDYARDFCFTSLVLVVPKANPARVRTLKDLARPEVKTIAIANDDRSAGYYARRLLEENGLWDKVKAKLVRPRFPVELLKLPAKGKVQASIAYAACFRSKEPEKKDLAANIKLIMDFQPEYCQTIACRAAVIKGADHPELGRKFIDFLTDDECQKILADGGFMTLSEPKCYPSSTQEDQDASGE